MLGSLQNTLSAVRAHTRGLLVSANNLANQQTDDFEPSSTVYLSGAAGSVQASVASSGSHEVDIPTEMVNMASSRRAIEANLAVIRTSDKTLGVLLDIVG
ncbi:MAG TPA: flagellar basal body rod C-terminal domain-containing protein [Candidatus Sumerlaeota bacterium]|nr:flagellar basal body rod C-terminal domain-containing protein [Candidatus Sumerlaeota bacterium]HPS03609.1 flagellar basal body rod C-terminal domain-containing protein [Candidatus Sumerlaeota bacterium]